MPVKRAQKEHTASDHAAHARAAAAAAAAVAAAAARAPAASAGAASAALTSLSGSKGRLSQQQLLLLLQQEQQREEQQQQRQQKQHEQRHARRKSRKQQQQEAAAKRRARNVVAVLTSAWGSSSSSSSSLPKCQCGIHLRPGAPGYEEVITRLLHRKKDEPQQQPLSLEQQQQPQDEDTQEAEEGPRCSEDLLDEIRAVDALYPPLLLLQKGPLQQSFLEEMEHIAAAAAAAVAAARTTSSSMRRKVYPWDTGRLFGTPCSIFLLLSPLDCFYCRCDAVPAAPAAAARAKSNSSSSSRSKEVKLPSEAAPIVDSQVEVSSSRRSSSQTSSSSSSSEGEEGGSSSEQLPPFRRLQSAFHCRCECCGSRVQGDGRVRRRPRSSSSSSNSSNSSSSSSSSGSSRSAIRLSFRISTFRAEDHAAVLDALLPAAYPAARPTVCIGLTCSPSNERLNVLLRELSNAYYKEPREVLLHALALHVEAFLVELPSQSNLWEEMQQRQQEKQQQQQQEQLELQQMRYRARQKTLLKDSTAAAAAAEAEAAAARDGGAAAAQQQAAEFHLAVAARLRKDSRPADEILSVPALAAAALVACCMLCCALSLKSCLYGYAAHSLYSGSLRPSRGSPSQISLSATAAASAAKAAASVYKSTRVLGCSGQALAASSLPACVESSAADGTSVGAAAAAAAAAAATAASPADSLDGSNDSNSSTRDVEQQLSLYRFLRHVLQQQPRHRRDFLLMEARAAVLSSNEHGRSSKVRHLIDSRLYFFKEFFFPISPFLLQQVKQQEEELQQQLRQQQQPNEGPSDPQQQGRQQQQRKRRGKKKHKMQYRRVYDDIPHQQQQQQEEHRRRQQQRLHQQQQQQHLQQFGLDFVADAARVQQEVAVLCTLEHPFLMRYHQCWCQLVYRPSTQNTASVTPTAARSPPPRATAAAATADTPHGCGPEAPLAAGRGRSAGGPGTLAAAAATLAASAAAAAGTPAAGPAAWSGEGAEPQAQLSVRVQMEYFELTLAKLIQQGKALSISEVWRLFMQLLEAMVCVHRAGICHRALRPSNVFFVEGPDGLTLKAAAASLTDCQQPACCYGLDEATLAFVAPEVRRGQAYTDKADMYSIGMLFLDMWRLCPGVARSAGPSASHSSLKACMPPSAASIVEMLLQEEPQRRPSSLQLLQSSALPPAVDAELFEAFLRRVGGCCTAAEEEGDCEGGPAAGSAPAAPAAFGSPAAAVTPQTAAGTTPQAPQEYYQQQHGRGGLAGADAAAAAAATTPLPGLRAGTHATLLQTPYQLQHRQQEQQRSSGDSSSSNNNNNSSALAARVRLTREVLEVLFARPVDPRSRKAFIDSLQEETRRSSSSSNCSSLRALARAVLLQHFVCHGGVHQPLPMLIPAAAAAAAVLTPANLLLAPTVRHSVAFAALDAANAAAAVSCCSGMQLQQSAAAAAAAAAKALPCLSEWQQFTTSASAAASAAVALQQQQRQLLDGSVFKRFSLGLAQAAEQQPQRDAARAPFGQVLPRQAACFQILFPVRQLQQLQQQQQPPQAPQVPLLQHITCPLDGELQRRFASNSAKSGSQQQQQQEQHSLGQNAVRQILSLLPGEEQQLVAVEAELLLTAVSALQQLLLAAGLPQSCSKLVWALPQLLQTLLQLHFGISEANSETALLQLLYFQQQRQQQRQRQQKGPPVEQQLLHEHPLLTPEDCTTLLSNLSTLAPEHIEAAAQQLNQLLAFSGDAFELLLLLHTFRSQLTTSRPQQQPQEQQRQQQPQNKLQQRQQRRQQRQLREASAAAAARAAELQRQISHALHLTLLLRAAADASTGRCCCMRLLLPFESANYDFGHLTFGVFLDAAALAVAPYSSSLPSVPASPRPAQQQEQQLHDKQQQPQQQHEEQQQQPKQPLLQLLRVGGGGYAKPFFQDSTAASIAEGAAPAAAARGPVAAAFESAAAASAGAAAAAAAAASSKSYRRCSMPLVSTLRGSCVVLSFDLDLETLVNLVSAANAAATAAAAAAALQREQAHSEASLGLLIEGVAGVNAERMRFHAAATASESQDEQALKELIGLSRLQQHRRRQQQQMHEVSLQHPRCNGEPSVILTTASCRLVPVGFAVANLLIRRGVSALMRIQPVIEVSRFQEALRQHAGVRFHVLIRQQQKPSSSSSRKALQQKEDFYWEAADDESVLPSLRPYVRLAAAGAAGTVQFDMTPLQHAAAAAGDSSSSSSKRRPHRVRYDTVAALVAALVGAVARRC
ncbi:hypothetical protein Efla_005324 [Eimeria flavescens]